MKSVLVIACMLFATAVSEFPEYDYETFEKIEKDCLSRLWTNAVGLRDMYLMNQTLDNFVSMVEKIEGKHRDWDIYKISRALLIRFGFDGMYFVELAGEREAVQFTDAKIRWDIVSRLVGPVDDQTAYELIEKDLTEREKCSMFFMMGHLINDTYRVDIDQEWKDVPMNSPAKPTSFLRSYASKRAKQPREQGVIRVNSSPDQAVSISKVLNAIVASRSKNAVFNVKDLYNIKAPIFPNDKLIDPLIGVTLGDVLSLAGLHTKPGINGSSYFGPSGTWDYDPTEFRLNETTSWSTNALLRGAFDGLVIGRVLQELDNVQGVRLSRLLDMYYSKEGILRNGSQSNGYSHCQRTNMLAEMSSNKIRESAVAFYLVHGFKEYNKVLSNADLKTKEAYQLMLKALSEMDADSCDDSSIVDPKPDVPAVNVTTNTTTTCNGNDSTTITTITTTTSNSTSTVTTTTTITTTTTTTTKVQNAYNVNTF